MCIMITQYVIGTNPVLVMLLDFNLDTVLVDDAVTAVVSSTRCAMVSSEL